MMDLSGIIYDGTFVSKKYYRNAAFPYQIHVPEYCRSQRECALILTNDGLNQTEAAAAEFLYRAGRAPACITIGISPGVLPASIPGGADRELRMNTYDLSTERYADFVVDEVLPYLTEKYHLTLSPSADLHLVSGGSSGGICAWNIAWYRNDYFHRVYASSPTFSALGNGEDIPFLIRKYESKPIRVFMDYSENEPDDYFGSSLSAGLNFERALRFAGYDFMSEYHAGEGHCSRLGRFEYAVFRLLYLWKDWDIEAVSVKMMSPRIEKIIERGDGWKTADYTFSSHKTLRTEKGEYRAIGNRIILTTPHGESKTLTEEFEDLSALALSGDRWRLYIGDKKRRCVYAATIAEDGSFDGIYVLATLHVATESHSPGVFDLCIDREDRLYAATELGIQCIRSYGIVDAILLNPERTAAVSSLELEEDGKLYALSSAATYVRQLKNKGIQTNAIMIPKHSGYYD